MRTVTPRLADLTEFVINDKGVPVFDGIDREPREQLDLAYKVNRSVGACCTDGFHQIGLCDKWSLGYGIDDLNGAYGSGVTCCITSFSVVPVLIAHRSNYRSAIITLLTGGVNTV